jgi:hypothetical protein
MKMANDPATYNSASYLPQEYQDDPEDIFRECMRRLKTPIELDVICVTLFREFWKEFQSYETNPKYSGGADAAIALLQTLSKSKTRETALQAYCILFAIGRTPLSETEIGTMFGLSRAAISKRIILIKDDLDLIPSRGMKSKKAVESYRISAKVGHKTRKEICQKTPSLFAHLKNQISALTLTPSSVC